MPSRAGASSYLAFDFGAESGRTLLAHLSRGIITIEEIHRFANEPVEYGGSLHWDVARLWLEVRRALATLRGARPVSIGVDAWGVDYALLGERGQLLHNPFHYRDRRTDGMMEEVFRIVPREEIYRATGIQFMPINTLYQLFAAKRGTPRLLQSADRLLTIPDLFHYWLTGNAVCEFTNATTTQLIDPATRTWSRDLVERLELPARLLPPVVEPGTRLGPLLPELVGDSSLAGTCVIAPASHDTGSAVASIAARNGTAFLSSGTWSLLGVEIDAPLITPETMRMNFTNEGGVCGTTRLLKNVMGLWMLQRCRHAWSTAGWECDYENLMALAAQEQPFAHLVDPDHDSFLHPASMPAAIDNFCKRTDQPYPVSAGAYARSVLESLAMKYRVVLDRLEALTGQAIETVRVIGGGSKNRILNQFTANAMGRTVLAGPAEATALGNVAMQILATGGASSLSEVRQMIDRSFPTEAFHPMNTEQWDREAERFRQYCELTYA